MGHERIGILPRTKPWSQVITSLTEFSEGSNNVAEIASQTIRNVRYRLRNIEHDRGVIAAFQFLISLSAVSDSISPPESLHALGIDLPDNPSPLRLASSLKKWTSDKIDSLEYAELACESAIDAIAKWHNSHRTEQTGLFDTPENPYKIWRGISNSRGFSEISRLFFASFTRRYLNYFIDRAASGTIKDIERRDKLYADIARHAFETSKITQSFSAGWFVNHVRRGPYDAVFPSETEIRGFLTHAFGKIRDELIRVEASE